MSDNREYMFDTATLGVTAPRILPLGILAAAGFLSSAGARIVDPLLAVMAQDLHSSVPAVSIVVAAFTLPYGLCQIVLGPVGDRFGKLRLILLALCGYAVFTGACGLAPNLAGLTLLRACSGAASAGLIPVCLAYIGDAVPYESRQLTLSHFLMGVMLAQTLAGPFGGAFGEYMGWRGVFFLLSTLAVLLACTLALRLRALPDRRVEAAFHLGNYSVLLNQPAARHLLSVTLLEGALVGSVLPFIASFLHEVYGLSFAAAGLVLACFGLGSLAYARTAHGFIPRLGEPGMVLLGGALMAVAVASALATGHWLAFVPAEFALGFGYFMLHTVLQARATELLPHARSTAVSSFVFMLFLGQALGALAAGGAIAAIGYHASFLISAGGLLVLGLGLHRFMQRSA